MNEQEWLRNHNDADAMLRFYLYDSTARLISQRKLRLFGCASCRFVWEGLVDLRSRAAVEVSERYADGMASEDALQEADQGSVIASQSRDPSDLASRFGLWVAEAHVPDCALQMTGRGFLSEEQPELIREILGNIFQPARRIRYECIHCKDDPQFRASGMCVRCGGKDWVGEPWLTPQVLSLAELAYRDRPGRKCSLCADEGAPCGYNKEARPGCLGCEGTGWIPDGVLCPETLAVLSDALEEAGCPDSALLSHLRSAGPHVRGCWALDLILGKE